MFITPKQQLYSKYALAAALIFIWPTMQVHADEIALKPVKITMDRNTLQKGLAVYTDICMGCHSMRYVSYRDLMEYPELHISRTKADALRGENALTAPLKSPLSEEDAKVSYGIVPPDMSVLAKARVGGGAYIYSIITGFAHDPSGRIPDGNYNLYFPGHRIAMNDPLGWLDHDPGDEKALLEQARDVASFLTFISDPHQIERHNIGKYVMGFMVIITILLWLLNREVWRDVKHGLPDAQFQGRERRDSDIDNDQRE
ncbi:MAG: cytochrome c1 [Mariprofundales bacterium]|nr:cytochrome c1 [Mariprofundales bacterium]